eukprot:TRINITY_DN3909_c0_g1_i1.p1 TRINITY_DN3909_c0_g1~~TRINITY_DN3909_c0_g1_i1.p1  ORF type:complete len:325 (+),score=28.36 TRINITY_DN3909_c0_g1_i1:308-1282(+)
MALDAHSLPISAGLRCAELENKRPVDIESVAKCLPYRKASHKQHGERLSMSHCTIPLMPQVVLSTRSRATVWALCKETRVRKHHYALRADYGTEVTDDAPVILIKCSVRARTSNVPVRDQRGLPGKCSPSVSCLVDLSVRRKKGGKSEAVFASKSATFSTGTGLQTDCGLHTGQSKGRSTKVTAAATDSDQTSPSQNGGGEKGLPKKPHPQVAPSEVVQAQLKALHNRDLGSVYEFASPANKAHTGPLSRFSEMLEARPYRVMLGHVSAEVLSTVTIGPTRFQQRIMIKGAGGTEAIFSWSLSKQEEGSYEGCWMTDTVRRDDR